jgi:TrmH family RNA methyltransferase
MAALITSRKNKTVQHLRRLGREASYRREQAQYLCDGHKLLREALQSGKKPLCVLWRGEPMFELPEYIEQLCADESVFECVSPMKDSPGPVFTLELPPERPELIPGGAIVLENVQDPGNVGTVIRTANALGCANVILVGACADLYSPKTARATMGAVFRQNVLCLGTAAELRSALDKVGLRLYGAALSENAADVRGVRLSGSAVAVGSEGRGLSDELLSVCDGQIIIPMTPGSESLNAAAAAAVLLWESAREKL